MKAHFLLFTAAAGLLLAATPNLWALPPRQHSAAAWFKPSTLPTAP